jgi:hypothetical protein
VIAKYKRTNDFGKHFHLVGSVEKIVLQTALDMDLFKWYKADHPRLMMHHYEYVITLEPNGPHNFVYLGHELKKSSIAVGMYFQNNNQLVRRLS